MNQTCKKRGSALINAVVHSCARSRFDKPARVTTEKRLSRYAAAIRSTSRVDGQKNIGDCSARRAGTKSSGLRTNFNVNMAFETSQSCCNFASAHICRSKATNLLSSASFDTIILDVLSLYMRRPGSTFWLDELNTVFHRNWMTLRSISKHEDCPKHAGQVSVWASPTPVIIWYEHSQYRVPPTYTRTNAKNKFRQEGLNFNTEYFPIVRNCKATASH